MRFLQIVSCVLFYILLSSSSLTLAQSETPNSPQILKEGINIRPLLNLERAAFRLALNPNDGYLYALEQDGTIVQIDLTGTSKTVILPSDHQLTEVAGLAFAPDGTLFLSGNEVVDKYNIARIQSARYNPESQKWGWKLFAQTEAYPRKVGATFNHNVNALIVSPDSQYLFANSGSRTDHGEIRDNEGTFPNLRETRFNEHHTSYAN